MASYSKLFLTLFFNAIVTNYRYKNKDILHSDKAKESFFFLTSMEELKKTHDVSSPFVFTLCFSQLNEGFWKYFCFLHFFPLSPYLLFLLFCKCIPRAPFLVVLVFPCRLANQEAAQPWSLQVKYSNVHAH